MNVALRAGVALVASVALISGALQAPATGATSAAPTVVSLAPTSTLADPGVDESVMAEAVESGSPVEDYLHLSDEAAVVLRPDGQVVTAYGRSDFRQHIFDILADVG